MKINNKNKQNKKSNKLTIILVAIILVVIIIIKNEQRDEQVNNNLDKARYEDVLDNLSGIEETINKIISLQNQDDDSEKTRIELSKTNDSLIRLCGLLYLEKNDNEKYLSDESLTDIQLKVKMQFNEEELRVLHEALSRLSDEEKVYLQNLLGIEK